MSAIEYLFVFCLSLFSLSFIIFAVDMHYWHRQQLAEEPNMPESFKEAFVKTDLLLERTRHLTEKSDARWSRELWVLKMDQELVAFLEAVGKLHKQSLTCSTSSI